MSKKRLPYSKNAIYNTIGILIYDLFLWLTTLVVVRLSSDYANAGIWQLSISITNIFSTIAVFNLSTYYISDVKGEFSTGEYYSAQLFTCVIAVVLCAIYTFFCGYRNNQLLCIVIYMVGRAVESFVGILYGVDQKNYRMDYIGTSYAIRGILSFSMFAIVLKMTGSIVLATIPMAVVPTLLLVLLDIPTSKKFEKFAFSFDKTHLISLIKETSPSVVSMAIFVAINTIPRQFLESTYDENILGYYATIAAPLVVFQVVAINIFNPILQDIAISFDNGDYAKLKSIAIKIISLLTLLLVIALLGGKLIGEKLYVLIYGDGICGYCYLMYAIIVATVLYALTWICWSVLVVLRSKIMMIISSIIPLIVLLVICNTLIDKCYLNGVTYSMLIAYTVFIIISVAFILLKIKSKRKKV